MKCKVAYLTLFRKVLLWLQRPNKMKISRTKFVMLFLVSAFAFQFISNSLLGPEVGLFPGNGGSFPETGSPVGWRGALSAILYPVKIVLIGPLSSLFKLPDPPPPFLVLAFALYWTVIALVLYYILGKIIPRKKHEFKGDQHIPM
jgi:hypothetical protein